MAKKDLPFGSSVPKGFSKPVDDTGTFIGPGYYDQPYQFIQKLFHTLILLIDFLNSFAPDAATARSHPSTNSMLLSNFVNSFENYSPIQFYSPTF